MRRPRRLLLASAAVLSVVAAACSSAGVGDRAATEPESRTSSTLPPSPPAAAAVGVAPPGTSAAAPEAPARAPGGKRGGSRSSASSSAPLDARVPANTPTTSGTSSPSPSTTAAPGLPPEKCPDAKTCRRHVFVNGSTDASRAPRWPVGGDGLAVVGYHVNPFNSGLPRDDVRGAVERAFETIARAAPALRFEFAGFTDRLPTPDDGHNDIGFANASTAHALNDWQGTTMTEVDMLLAATGHWTWSPCEQRDGSCTKTCVRGDSRVAVCGAELQSIVTHEGLHWAGLGDMWDEETDRELSASPNGSLSDRFRSTLALGDVLGLRALYPCSCPLPPIYAP